MAGPASITSPAECGHGAGRRAVFGAGRLDRQAVAASAGTEPKAGTTWS
jgi:hypothetical protein